MRDRPAVRFVLVLLGLTTAAFAVGFGFKAGVMTAVKRIPMRWGF